MLGDQTKSLIIISKAKGWDPTVIPSRDDKPAVDLSNWDKSPQKWEVSDSGGQWSVRNLANQLYGAPAVGGLPESIPATKDQFPGEEGPKYSEGISWDGPDVSRENKNRATSGADIYPGGGWQEGA